jgi:hypothetical protein
MTLGAHRAEPEMGARATGCGGRPLSLSRGRRRPPWAPNTLARDEHGGVGDALARILASPRRAEAGTSQLGRSVVVRRDSAEATSDYARRTTSPGSPVILLP